VNSLTRHRADNPLIGRLRYYPLGINRLQNLPSRGQMRPEIEGPVKRDGIL
jgi:hypothetical protein